MSKLNKEQIITALECCYTDKRTCSDCPFQDPDKYMECSGLALSAIELIEELVEELAQNSKALLNSVKESLHAKGDKAACSVSIYDIDEVLEEAMKSV